MINKNYCPECFNIRFITTIWEASRIPSRYISNKNKCEYCNKICEPVSKSEARRLKINKLLDETK